MCIYRADIIVHALAWLNPYHPSDEHWTEGAGVRTVQQIRLMANDLSVRKRWIINSMHFALTIENVYLFVAINYIPYTYLFGKVFCEPYLGVLYGHFVGKVSQLTYI